MTMASQTRIDQLNSIVHLTKYSKITLGYKGHRLAIGTKMSAALTNENAFDIGSTSRTGFSGAVIHSKVILEFTATIDPVKGRTVAPNAFLQDVANRIVQCFRLFEGDGIRDHQGMYLCNI